MTVDSKVKQIERPSLNTYAAQVVNDVEVAKAGSKLDGLIWLVCIVLLIAATLVNHYLPQYLPAGKSPWVRMAVIIGLVVVALLGLYQTYQGKGFVQLLKDARVELHRITWPKRPETIKTSWIVMVLVTVMAVFIWALDFILASVVEYILK